MASVQEDGGLTPQEVRKLVDAERLKIAVRRQAKLEEEQAEYEAYRNDIKGRNKFALKAFLIFVAVIGCGIGLIFLLPKLQADRGLKSEPMTPASSSSSGVTIK